MIALPGRRSGLPSRGGSGAHHRGRPADPGFADPHSRHPSPRVATAPTAMAGLQLVVSNRPDVVLLDLGLPDLDGHALLAMIRSVTRCR